MGLPNIFDKANTFFNNLGKPKYDLNTIEGINSIPVESFEYDPKDGKQYAFNKIEYILQRKATEHKKNGRMDLAIACLRKANEIMPLSDMMYPVDDYLRLAKYLRLNKQFGEAHKVEEKYLGSNRSDLIERAIPTTEYVNSLQIDKALKHDTDLVEAVTNQYHCGECAKYIGRVYSISGKDKRFPKLPDYIKENASHCGIILYPFYTTGCINDPYTQEAIWGKDVIKFSNRPYVDSRPQKWIDGYEHLLEITHQRELDEKNSKQAQLEYEQIVIKLPDLAPKSQGGYLRMKKSKSKNYQSLKTAAESAGIIIKDIEGDDNTPLELPQSTSQLPPECSEIKTFLENLLGANGFTYSRYNKNHDFECGKFRIAVPENKPGRYVVFSQNPQKIIIVHNQQELESTVTELCK